ncbi:MAG: TetR/AcrR family transcriptional regulator [Novosphingobium sp.]|uniref:TetR/AcrR family transcriptional regulator n=1 Tax=Novosphingobium sp. TaxID=1874826 RepID=UPI003B9C159F
MVNDDDLDVSAPKVRPERGQRRQAIARAALEILGMHGSKGLTHRAIDQHLKLPDGSTSAYFRRREDLIGAVVRELFQNDFTRYDTSIGELISANQTLTLDDAVSFFHDLVQNVRRNISETTQLARYECFLLARRDKEANRLLQDLFAAREKLDERIFQTIGAADPQKAAARLGYTLRGVFFTFAFLPEPADRLDIIDRAFIRRGILAAMRVEPDPDGTADPGEGHSA